MSEVVPSKFNNGANRNTLMISPQNINGFNNQENNNLHSDIAAENALNTMTTMH